MKLALTLGAEAPGATLRGTRKVSEVLMAVDRSGCLCGLGTAGPASTWTDLWRSGVLNLVPGSPLAIVPLSAGLYGALVVDRLGVLNFASFDIRRGWVASETVGPAVFFAGSAITVVEDGDGAYQALLVDRFGTLNTLRLIAGKGWVGPETVRGSTFIAGSAVQVVVQANGFAALLIDRDGELRVHIRDDQARWTESTCIGLPTLVPGGLAAVAVG